MAVMGKLADYPVDLIGKKAKLSIKTIDEKDNNGVYKVNSEGRTIQKNVITRVMSVNEVVPNILQSKLDYNESIDKKPLLDINNLDLEDAIPF
jgi:predicted RNA methylase